MVGMGEVAGDSAAGRTVSGLARYANRRFSTGAALTHIRDVLAARQAVFGDNVPLTDDRGVRQC